MLIFFAVLGGFILDAIFGDPLWLPHPVVHMGKVISFLDRSLRKILPKTPRRERIGGCLLYTSISVHHSKESVRMQYKKYLKMFLHRYVCFL